MPALFRNVTARVTTSIKWTMDSHGKIPEAWALSKHYVIILRILSGLLNVFTTHLCLLFGEQHWAYIKLADFTPSLCITQLYNMDIFFPEAFTFYWRYKSQLCCLLQAEFTLDITSDKISFALSPRRHPHGHDWLMQMR